MTHETLFKYIGFSAIVLLLFGLLGWYLFMRQQTARIESSSESRGFSIGIPSFLGSRGSTSANTEGTTGDSASAPESVTGGSSSGASAFLKFLGLGKLQEGIRATSVLSGDTTATTTPTIKRAPRFFRVSQAPVAGAAFIVGSTTRLRYVERATGHVFDVDAATGDAVRLTNTLTPKIYEAYIGGGNVIIERTLEEGKLVTQVGTIGTTTKEGLASLPMTNLGVQVDDIATLQTSSDILILSRGSDGINLIRATWNGRFPKQLATIPAGDFRIHWLSNSRIVLAEKAGSGITGSAFEVGASLVPLVRNVPGLTVLPHPSSKTLLYSSDTGGALFLYVQPESTAATTLPLQTVTEKCVWAPQGAIAYCAAPQGNPGPEFLNRWYRGEMHTEDIWYTVHTDVGTVEKLFTIDSAQAIDVESPAIDQSGNYLAFVNARDKSLWILRISEQ